MTLSIVPRRFWDFDDEDNWLTEPLSNVNSGLSVSEDEKNVFVEAQVPGIDPDNIEVTYHDGYVWVRGEEKEEEKDKKRKYYRRSSQSFSYRVAVPGEINENVEPEAVYKNGVMTVKFEKSPKSLPKKITVKKIEAKK